MAWPSPPVAYEQRSLPTLRDRADFPSCGVVASLLGHYPTASAPPCLRGNLPRSRPREILRQAPGRTRHPWRTGSLPLQRFLVDLRGLLHILDVGHKLLLNRVLGDLRLDLIE